MKLFVIFFTLLLICKAAVCQWTINYNVDHIGCLTDIEFATSNSGFIVGENGLIGTTLDAALNWTIDSLEGLTDLRIIDFISPDTGMICCSPAPAQDILMTYDRGANWNFPLLNNGVSIHDMEFVKGGNIIFSSCTGASTYGFVAGDYYSYNIGSTEIDPTAFCYQMEFPSKDTGFITGDFIPIEPVVTSVYKTIDGGLTWYTHENMYGPLYFTSFPTTQVGYGIGYEQRLWKSTDSGESWSLLPYDFGEPGDTESGFFLDNIYFYDKNVGYLETSKFSDPDYSEEILRTTDGGSTWIKTDYDHIPNEYVVDFFCTSEDTCYFITCNYIYKTVNGGGEDTINTNLTCFDSINFSLFPNPANNYLEINISQSIHIDQIQTYNSMGEEVFLPFNENRIADVTTIPPGLYFTIIRTDSGKGSRKWIKN